MWFYRVRGFVLLLLWGLGPGVLFKSHFAVLGGPMTYSLRFRLLKIKFL